MNFEPQLPLFEQQVKFYMTMTKFPKNFENNSYRILYRIDRLNRLIDKILDLEKFETGKQTIHPSQNNLITTIEHSIEPLQQLIKIEISACILKVKILFQRIMMKIESFK